MDFNIVSAPILGMAALTITRVLVYPKGLFKKKTEAQPASAGDDKD